MTSIRRPDSSVPLHLPTDPKSTTGAESTSGADSVAPASEAQGTSGVATAPGDLFEGVGTQGPTLSGPVKERADAAVSTFQDRVSKILHHDAESLALGHTPARTTADLSDEQKTQLQGAAKDMLMEMPIGALSPAATAKAKSFLESKGVSTEGFEQKTLKELGPVGGELAKELAADLKDASPGAYYGLAAAGAVAVGAYGYMKGSAALEKLGVKPELDTKLFNDQVNVRAKASWGEKLKDPNLTLGADGTFKVSPTATLKVGGNVNAAGPSIGSLGVKSADASLGYETERYGVSGKARFGEGARFEGADVNGRVKIGDDTNLSGQATLDGQGSVTSATVDGNTKIGDDTSLEGQVRLGEGGRFQGATAKGRTTIDEAELAAQAEVDEDGGLTSGQATLSTDLRVGPNGRDQLAGSVTGRFGQGGRFEGLDAQARYQLNTDPKLTVEGSASTDASSQLTKGNANIRLNTDNASLGLGVNYDRPTDALGYKLDGQYKTGGLTLSGEAAFDRDLRFNQGSLGVTGTLPSGLDLNAKSTFSDGRLSTVTGGVSYDQEPWKLSADVSRDVRSDVTTGSLSLGYRPSDNLDLQVRGSYDTNGDKRIGVGLTWRF